jgi:hypothetical protein
MKYIIDFFVKRISKELPKPISSINIDYYNKKRDENSSSYKECLNIETKETKETNTTKKI